MTIKQVKVVNRTIAGHGTFSGFYLRCDVLAKSHHSLPGSLGNRSLFLLLADGILFPVLK